ncbi:TetR/AcrR family transcriptional regulator [Chitinophaga pendula]|uniref:TetR/AcrR family transcriptional regulator n=1 Tax=Chitinophaga TaxID=79328 RepID=UPI000BB0A0D3|nr:MULTISPECIES: TetR/AcrR family transcriptional regulator [Chitinophaga]ASZ09814.1 TetR family transcriptional regulator [Chitinophaga sp. MD30]UCJ07245.1 TetR/AcrR family transcriptional regulator [Chitinophaga pendula]
MRTRDENKEQAIRNKAIEIIVKDGLDGLSMQKLAKAAGVSPATIYIYYKDREDLIIQLGLEASTALLTSSLKNFSPEMPFEEGLKVQWRNRADYFLKNPMQVEFIEQLRYSPLYPKVMNALIATFGEIMGKFVNNAIKRKELVTLPFEVYWSVAFAPLYQLIKFHTQGKSYANRTFTMTDKVMMQTLQLVLKALRP